MPTAKGPASAEVYTCNHLDGSWLVFEPHGAEKTSISVFASYRFRAAFFPANNDNTIETNRADQVRKSTLFDAIHEETGGFLPQNN